MRLAPRPMKNVGGSRAWLPCLGHALLWDPDDPDDPRGSMLVDLLGVSMLLDLDGSELVDGACGLRNGLWAGRGRVANHGAGVCPGGPRTISPVSEKDDCSILNSPRWGVSDDESTLPLLTPLLEAASKPFLMMRRLLSSDVSDRSTKEKLIRSAASLPAVAFLVVSPKVEFSGNSPLVVSSAESPT